MSVQASSLSGPLGERVALCKVAVSAVLADLLAEVTVTQTYRNEEDTNIEATYTFPLPVDAVLLSLDVALGGRRLQGVVVEKSQAEEQYEEAIEEGDAAVLLENPEPGLYTMNVGNLLAGETAIITVRYALLHRWNGDCLRFHLPTTIAPRYGKSPLAPHQAPERSLAVEGQFSVDIEVTGALRNAQFDCPTHPVRLSRADGKLKLTLAGPLAAMDRDFVLNVRMPVGERNFVMTGQDGDGIAAIASFQPFFPGLRHPQPLNLVVVMDCSDSMLGDSMNQARRALNVMLERLQPADRLNIVAFGTHVNAWSSALLECTPGVLVRARHFASTLKANMGATEIEAALESAYASIGHFGPADIFLVTDGHVSNWQPVVEQARQSGHRFFTVGVGSSVSEGFVRGLASATDGACELVTPNEGMADSVVRHFDRMRMAYAKRVALRWPAGAVEVHPAHFGAIFEGETVTASARYAQTPAGGDVVLEIELATGEIAQQKLTMTKPAPAANRISTVARLAAAARVAAQDDDRALATALRYQLVGPFTRWLVVVERADSEKAVHLPRLRKAPHTVAAGWGGLGQAYSAFLATEDFGVMKCASFSAIPRGNLFDADDTADDNLSRDADDTEAAEDFVYSFGFFPLISTLKNWPASVNATSAHRLLKERFMLPLFAEVWSRAEELGVEADDAATIVLDQTLRMQTADMSLRRDAQRALGALTLAVDTITRKIGRDIAAELRQLAGAIVARLDEEWKRRRALR